MKLHLPKRLLTALLAAFTAISLSTGSAAWGLSITGDGNLETITLNASDAYVGAYAQYTINSNKEGVLTRVNTNENFGNAVNLKFTLNDTAISNIPANDLTGDGIGLVWGRASTDAHVGLQLYDNDNDGAAEITGRWANKRWDSTNNKASEILTDAQYELKMSMSANTSWVTTPPTGEATTTTVSGLKTSDRTFNTIYYNINYVDTFQTQEYSDLTFSNDSGWSRNYTLTEFNNAYSSPLSVAAGGFGNENDVIAGGVGGLTITATEAAPVNLSNDIYLAAPAEGKNTISINNAGAVELNGDLYLVENASIASTGKGNITISGVVTDKNVPTGAESNPANGAYTLSLSGTGYNFTGEVDVHGLHIAEGAEATFSNKLTINSTITGSGNMTLGGELIISDAWALDNATYTYADGATSGYRTGYSATVFDGTLSVNDGIQVVLTLQDANSIGDVTWSGGIINATITSSVYDVNESLAYSIDSMGEATRLLVNQNGILDFTGFNLENEESATNDVKLIQAMNKISGSGEVKLANGAVIQTGGDNTNVKLAARYTVAGANASLTLTSWKKTTWREWIVANGGSLTVGDNGEGTLKVLAGQRLNIQNGGQVQVGTLNLGYADTNLHTDNPGSLVMSGATSKLTVGSIVMQNGISNDATWLNEINITGGTLKVTGETAITYNALNVKTNVTLGGSSENESVLLQTGDTTGWTMSKQSDAASTFNVGHVTIDAANTQCITFNGATITGHIKNNAQLALGADVVFGNSSTITNAGTLTLHHRENTVNLNTRLQKVTSLNTGHTIVDGTGNKTLSDDLTFGGNLTLKGGSFGTSTEGVVNSITGSSGKLVLDDVDAYIGSTSNQRLNTNLELINGTTLHLTHNDVFNYSSYSTSVGTDSIIALGATRQSVSNNAIVMAGGTIYGIGGIYTGGNYTAGLDFHQSGKIVATENSLIATGIASRDASDVVTIEVASGKTLTLSSYTAGETTSTAALVGSGSFTKTGTGTLLYKGASFTNSLVLNEGVFEYYTDADVTHNGTISGTAEFRKSGTGILTLHSAKTSVTTLNVIAGEIIYNSTSDTTHTLKGNSGSTFEKTGAGALTANTGNFAGDILISEGTLKNAAEMDKDRKVTVANGATIDLNGKAAYYNLTLQGGAILTNDASDSQTGTNKKQLHTITLQGNATVQGISELGMVGSGHVTSSLYLAGHTLTKDGENTFHLYNTTVKSAGTIEVNAGLVKADGNTAGTLDLTLASLKINGGTFELAHKSQNIQNLALTGGNLSIGSGLTLTTQGDVEFSGGTISGNLCITSTINQTGGTLDLAGAVLSAVDLSHLDYGASDTSTSGLVNTTYYLVSGDSVDVSFSQTTVTVGGTEYNLNTDTEGKALASFNVTDGMYYVAAGDTITAGGNSASDDTEQALRYIVDGTLNIAGDVSVQNISAKNAQVNVLESVTLSLTQDFSTINELNAANATVSLGQDVTLTLGNDKTATFHNIGTLNAGTNSTIHLNAGATLNAFTKGTGTVTLKGSGVYDLGSNNTKSNVSGLDQATWTGTTKVSDVAYCDLTAAFNSLGNTKSTVHVSNASGYFNTTDSNNPQLNTNLHIAKNTNITLTNGNSVSTQLPNRKALINGKVSGEGNIIVTQSENKNTVCTFNYEFAGDVSKWTGTLSNQVNKTGFTIGVAFTGATNLTEGDNIINVNILNEGKGLSNVTFAGSKSHVMKGIVDVNNLYINQSTTFENSVKTTNIELNSDATFSGEVAANVLSATEGKSITLNGGTAEAQMIHSIGSFNGTVSNLKLGAYTTLSFAKGTETIQKVNTVDSLTTSTGAGISLGDYATLKITEVPAALKSSYSDGNNDASSSISLAITGGTGSVLDLAMDSTDFWKNNNTVTLVQGENSSLIVRISSGYLANSVFGPNTNAVYGDYATTNLGGSALSMANDTMLVLRKANSAENFGAGDITLEGTVDLRVYGSVSKDNTSLTNNISGDTLKITNGPVEKGNTSDGGITLTGNLNLTKLSNQARKEVVLSGESMQFGTLEVNSSNGSTTTISGNATADSVSVQQGTLSVTADGELNLGDTATITAEESKTASMERVQLSEEGISSADETGDTKGTVSDAKVTLAALAEGTSFSIEDVTLSNVNIEAANAETKVNLSGLSASDVQLTKGEFHMLDTAQPQVVGTGGSAINLVEGVPTGLQFSTSLLNGMTLGADASMVVDLGNLSGFTGMDSGKPTFSITLEGFRISDYLAENSGIYFAADSWLGQLLVAQGASQYVKSDTLEAGTQATAGSGSGVSVRYYNSTSSVGTVIIISGLQVPEPASATLGLTALMMLCARRRRRA